VSEHHLGKHPTTVGGANLP